MLRIKHFILLTIICSTIINLPAQTVVNSLAELRTAVQNSGQHIILSPGNYNIEDLPSDSRFFPCSGSDNTIELIDVYIEFPVDATSDQHFLLTGSDITLRGGTFENTYSDGIEEITDYVAYNNDRNNFANGGDPHLVIQGDNNRVVGIKMTVRGSFPYGYGSIYGINNNNQFGLSKRGGIAVQGTNAVIDSCELQMKAFGHAIYIQSPSNHTIIKNTIVIGDLRLGSEMLAETDPTSLPSQSNFQDFSVDHLNPDPIDPTRGISLCEDGIRLYNNGGSMEVENCRVEKMRGGIRGYLGSGSVVTNSTAIDCESTNFNLPSGGSITSSFGNFAYCPLSDYRLGRSNTTVELTIIPSPHASGLHNLLDLQGNNHDVILHRTDGPLDSDEERTIVITGGNSTLVNETEYTIVLDEIASGNTISSCGAVIDNGSNNTIIVLSDCGFDTPEPSCAKSASLTQAECYDDSLGVQVQGGGVGFIQNNDWTSYNDLDLTDMNSVEITYSNQTNGGSVELRLDAVDGIVVGEVQLPGTGNWNTYETAQINIARVEGIHNLYLVFTGDDGYLFNLDKFSFSEDVVCENAVTHIEAECFDDMFEVQTEGCSEGTLNMGWINNGDWAKYSGIDLSGMNSIKARVSGKTTGSVIEVRLDAVDGDLIGTLEVSNTGGNQTWVTDSVNILATSGVHDIYLVFVGGDGYLYNINYIGFSEDKSIVTNLATTKESTLSIYPNPTTGVVYFSENMEYKVFSSIGQSVLTGRSSQVDLSSLPHGLYNIQIEQFSYKLIKQ